ncbi:tRNA (adenosine(37)-N6)-dimethylallyltransferase MiaA [Hydrogenimonas sp.]
MKTVAILGPTASGKSDLAIALAKESGAYILSLDSLSVYRKIDIASAKPSLRQREEVKHFGIDEIEVDTHFSVGLYTELFREASRRTKAEGRPLIIVGGTGFYLKMLIEGISDLPPMPEPIKERVSRLMLDLHEAYKTLRRIDRNYADSISGTDRYRIEKGLQIYFLTDELPSRYFKANPPKPLLDSVALYEIAVDKETLQKRIEARTKAMFKEGLVDEIADLEYRYGRACNPMKAIGIREVLDYFDAKSSLKETEEKIVIHTRQLAKRQRTFNRTQFPPHPLLDADALFKEVSVLLKG